ncbi:MAG: AAA family ATPase [Candidatus Margulisiibacteriota bacterium]
MFIGLVGKNGAGKTSVAEYLVSKGFSFYSLSDIVREEATKNNLALSRENLIVTGNELKKKIGEAVLAKRTWEKASLENEPLLVFDSIRNVAEIDYLKAKGVKIIGVDAPIELRYKRIQERKRDSDHLDFVTFVKLEEYESNGKSFGQNLNETFKKADFILENNSTLDDLHQEIDQLLRG